MPPPSRSFLALTLLLAGLLPAWSVEPLPPAASRAVDFVHDIKPLFEASCIKCHAKGKAKGGFSMETRDAFLKGGDTGPGADLQDSAKSLVVELVAGLDPDSIMPKKGSRFTPEQIGLLRAWIEQGMAWDSSITFAKPAPLNLHPHAVELPAGSEAHPLDRLLREYLTPSNVTPSNVTPPEVASSAAAAVPVDDRTFARRVYLDLIGLLPSPAQLDAFLADPAPDKRSTLARSLLNQNRAYTEHWLTFWNDLLRNDYQGTGFIDGGRRQVSRWLYSALLENRPFDRFVAELINPGKTSEGFSKGVIWRGNVNASMTPPMQAAQNISQVFMGVNLKCASCHDSFINDWALADAYGMAAIYNEGPMELIHCDKPTGKQASASFLYPELGVIDPAASKPERLARLATLMTGPSNGRLARTIVNRFWARLLGRGLVEPVDDMEQAAWSPALLDWLAEDLVAHGYDLKRTLELIVTSRAYQMPLTPLDETAPSRDGEKSPYRFKGPIARRLTAEQFSDALSTLAGTWARLPASLEFELGDQSEKKNDKANDKTASPLWIWTGEPLSLSAERAAARETRRQLDAVSKKLAIALRETEAGENAGGTALEKAKTAMLEAAAALTSAQTPLTSLGVPNPDAAPDSARHSVVFRKKFTLTAIPQEAYATLLASQRFEIHVNGKVAKSTMRDGARNGRVALFDLRPWLVAGENTVVIDVSSHTEKQMNDSERKQFPGSTAHLNTQSGLAFYLHCKMADSPALDIVSDASWRVRRNPEANWNSGKLSDAAWSTATRLPEGSAPIDEGPGLEPLLRQDFANLPVELGSQLVPAVSIASHTGNIRASMLASDPLQNALDRPNREQVITARANAPTTLQALELTNGATLDRRINATAATLTPAAQSDAPAWIDALYRQLLSRPPSEAERAISLEMLGAPIAATGVADLLWALVNLPEFQLIP